MWKFILLILCALLACTNGNESDELRSLTTLAALKESSPSDSLDEHWEVQYFSLLDECGLLEPGVTDFIDYQHIGRSNNTVNLSSDYLLGGPYSGSYRSESSFLVSAKLAGDLFGDGVYCELNEELAYNHTTSTSAINLYHIWLDCADGFRCDSALRGPANLIDANDQ